MTSVDKDLDPDPDQHLDAELAATGRRGHRALVAGIVRGGERRCRGWAADGGCPPDESSLFEIGSVTKPLTGVLLAEMHLRGEVALDDPLSRHLPGPRPAWRHREPTLCELATHRSGLPNTPVPTWRELVHQLGAGRQDPWAQLTPQEYSRLVAQQSPRRGPGTGVRYSSLAVALLGDALAARAGRPYEQLLTERVLRPLGMSSTSVLVPPERRHRLLTGHSRRGRPRPAIEDLLAPAGGLRSCADDMTRFLSACLTPPPGPLGEALSLAQQTHVRTRLGVRIGLCWIVSIRRRHPRVVWHDGGTWGFAAFAGLAPEQGTAAVVMSNTLRSVDTLGLRLVEGGPAHRDRQAARRSSRASQGLPRTAGAS